MNHLHAPELRVSIHSNQSILVGQSDQHLNLRCHHWISFSGSDIYFIGSVNVVVTFQQTQTIVEIQEVSVGGVGLHRVWVSMTHSATRWSWDMRARRIWARIRGLSHDSLKISMPCKLKVALNSQKKMLISGDRLNIFVSQCNCSHQP